MSVPPPDSRPPIASAMQRVSQITSVSLSMALPALLGYWVDGKLGTTPWLLIVGGALGLVTGVRSLVRMADSMGRSRRPPGRLSGPEDSDAGKRDVGE